MQPIKFKLKLWFSGLSIAVLRTWRGLPHREKYFLNISLLVHCLFVCICVCICPSMFQLVFVYELCVSLCKRMSLSVCLSGAIVNTFLISYSGWLYTTQTGLHWQQGFRISILVVVLWWTKGTLYRSIFCVVLPTGWQWTLSQHNDSTHTCGC